MASSVAGAGAPSVDKVDTSETSHGESEDDSQLVIPERETKMEDFVNTGLINFNVVRANWSARPDNFKPKSKKKVNLNQVHEELEKGVPFSDRVPLPEFLKVMNEIWEAEGII